MLIKYFTPKGLFWRSLLIVIVPLVLLQGVVAFIFFERHWDTVSRQLALGIAGDIVTTTRYLRTYTDPDQQAWMLQTAAYEMQLDISFQDGEILPNRSPEESAPIRDRFLREALAQRLVYPYQINTQRPDTYISIRVQLAEGVLTILFPKKRLFSSTTYIFLMWMVGTGVIVTGIAVVFLRNQMRPIRRLAAAAQSLGKGRPVENFKPAGAAEIRRAASAFLDMQERIGRQITQRTEMLAGVSHDLRTPLTRMKLQLAMLRQTRPDAEPDIADLEADLVEMEKMIDEYLAFARGQGSEEPVDVDLVDILNEVADGARRNGGNVAFASTPPLVMPLRPNAIKRCLTNLVENATRHGSHVEITTTRHDETVEIAVEDDGPGIPEEQREAVFKPFYRLDGARNLNTGGAGLGLAIARDVIRGHGGDITMMESAVGGLRAEVRLPL